MDILPETSPVSFDEIVNNISTGDTKIANVVKNGGFMQGLNTSMANLVSQMDFSWAAEIGSKFVMNIGTGISTAWDTIKENVKSIFSSFDLSEKVEDAKEWGSKFIANFSSNMIHKWDNWKDSVAGIFKFFDLSSLAEDAKTWGADMILNFITGVKEKSGELAETIGGVAGTIAARMGFSEPEEGPLSNFHTFAPDMIDLFTKGIRENKKSIFSEIEDIATGIKETFSEPVSIETDIAAKGILHSFETPDMTNLFTGGPRSNVDRIYSEVNKITDNMKSNFADISVPQPLNYKYISESIQPRTVSERSTPDVTIQNININMEGMNIESDYDVDRMSDRMIEKLSERLRMLGIFNDRALGGTAW